MSLLDSTELNGMFRVALVSEMEQCSNLFALEKYVMEAHHIYPFVLETDKFNH